MFSFFKKRQARLFLASPRLSQWKKRWDARQQRWAERLQTSSMRINRWTLILYFTLFFTAFAAACIYIIGQALSNHGSVSKIDVVTIPHHVVATPSQDRTAPGSEYARIVQFHDILDSLKRYNRYRYDSICTARPGLIDSMRRVIEMHQEKGP